MEEHPKTQPERQMAGRGHQLDGPFLTDFLFRRLPTSNARAISSVAVSNCSTRRSSSALSARVNVPELPFVKSSVIRSRCWACMRKSPRICRACFRAWLGVGSRRISSISRCRSSAGNCRAASRICSNVNSTVAMMLPRKLALFGRFPFENQKRLKLSVPAGLQSTKRVLHRKDAEP